MELPPTFPNLLMSTPVKLGRNGTVVGYWKTKSEKIFKNPKLFITLKKHQRSVKNSWKDCNILNDLARSLTLKILKLQRSFKIFLKISTCKVPL